MQSASDQTTSPVLTPAHRPGPSTSSSRPTPRSCAPRCVAEGYQVSEGPCEGPGRARWALQVTPDDDGLVAMVDVYGGWLDEET